MTYLTINVYILFNSCEPPETLREILSFLNKPEDFQSASQVNKLWNTHTIKIAVKRENDLILQFAKFLGDNLPEKPDFEVQIQEIVGSIKLLNSINLITLKKSISFMKGKIIERLTKLRLSEDELNKLENLYEKTDKNYFFKNIFELVKLNLKFDAMNPEKRLDFIKNLIHNQDEINKILELAYLNKHCLDFKLLSYISEAYVGIDRLDIALMQAKAILKTEIKNRAIADICCQLIKKGDLDKAIEIDQKEISEEDKEQHSRVFCEIISAYVDKNEIDKAIEFRNKLATIGAAEGLDNSNTVIIFYYIRNHEFDKAKELAKKLINIGIVRKKDVVKYINNAESKYTP